MVLKNNLFSDLHNLQIKTSKYGIKVTDLNYYRKEFLDDICEARIKQYSSYAVYESLMLHQAQKLSENIQEILIF